MAEGSNTKRSSAEDPNSSATNGAQPVESKLGDFGKGSREETQGGTKPNNEWQEKLAPS